MRRGHSWSVVLLSAVLAGCGGNAPEDRIVFEEPMARGVNFEPAWGPDGVRIAYEHYAQNEEERAQGMVQIWVGSLASRGNFIAQGYSPAWSPDGQALAIVRNANIWRIDLDSGAETQLTFEGSCYGPAWSPDGVHIAYRRQAADSAGLWMMDVRTFARKRLTDVTGADPAWAPGGDRIAFRADIGEGGFFEELAVVDTSGGPLLRLTNDDKSDNAPAWSPDGASIAWYASYPDTKSLDGIWIMNSDGSSPHLLLHWGGYPSWSPDGKSLAWGGYNSKTNIQSIWVANADGSNARELPY